MSKSNLIRTTFLTVPVVALGLFFAPSADARRNQNKKPSLEQREAKRAAHAEKMEKRVRNKLAPKLGLDAATTEQLVGILRAHMGDRQAARKTVKQERKKLRELVKSNAADAALDTQMANLRKAMEAIPKQPALFDDVRKILTPTQQAKFLLMSQKFNHPRMKGNHGQRGMDEGQKGRRGQRGEGRMGKRGKRGKRGTRSVPASEVEVDTL